MNFFLFICLISFTAGFLWGRYTTKMAFTRVYANFTDEMHRQYLTCLKKHGVKIEQDSSLESNDRSIARLAS